MSRQHHNLFYAKHNFKVAKVKATKLLPDQITRRHGMIEM
jgi:hypothetical protein